MALYTSYLAFLRKFDYNPVNVFPNQLESVEFVYVMRNRGNNIVAPSEFLLKQVKDGEIGWEEYRRRYILWITHSSAILWMKEVGERAEEHDVVLICYEKDTNHCHRTLLAEAVSKWSGAEYKGELTEA